MPPCVRYADHHDRNKDCGQHCGCDDVVHVFPFRSVCVYFTKYARHCQPYGAGVMHGLTGGTYWLANAWINSSSLTNIWKVWSPIVTAKTVEPTGRAWLESSVSTFAFWIWIMFSLCFVVSCMCVLYHTRHHLSTLLAAPPGTILSLSGREPFALCREWGYTPHLVPFVPHDNHVSVFLDPTVAMPLLPILGFQRPAAMGIITVFNDDVADAKCDVWSVHCVALVGCVVVVCHVRIVPSKRLFVKCKSGIVAWYTCCLLSPMPHTSWASMNKNPKATAVMMMIVVIVCFLCCLFLMPSLYILYRQKSTPIISNSRIFSKKKELL